MSYVYDIKQRLLHLRGSECEVNNDKCNIYVNLDYCFRFNYRACPVCLKKEYFARKRELCREAIDKLNAKFIFIPDSGVFHKADCKMVRTSLDVQGFGKYKKAVASGRVPCKICNPQDDEIVAKKPSKIPEEVRSILRERRKSEDNTKLTKKTYDALKRLKRARKDRALISQATSEAEARDIITLSRTEYAFWAAKGYKNFHLRDCPRLKGLTDLKGFSLFNHAKSAGYTPCKICRPTKKNNITVSIPIFSKVRQEESIDSIKVKFEKVGYRFYESEEELYIETPVGKWKIYQKNYPIKLEHINMLKGSKTDFHVQPKEFLSMTDVYLYIHKHDSQLLREY